MSKNKPIEKPIEPKDPIENKSNEAKEDIVKIKALGPIVFHGGDCFAGQETEMKKEMAIKLQALGLVEIL